MSAAGVTLLTMVLTACGGGGDGSAVVASTAVAPTSVPASASEVALEISATEPNTYHWDVLGVGRSVHVDSSEEFTAIPGTYKGLKFLRTANADRYSSAAGAIAFQTNKEVAILVAYDAQAAPQRPQWLASWTDTNHTLTTSVAVYRLYRATFAAGAVTLGGNELGFNSYAVVVDDGTALGNAPPTIVGNPPRSVSANRDYEFLPTAGDADGDRLVFGSSNLPPWLTLDSATGRLAGTPGPAAVRTYGNIVLRVSDGESTAELPPFALTVSAVGTNSPPTISAGSIPTGTQFEPYAYQPLATDPDGDRLTFSIANRPRWASFDAASGRLAGTPGRGDAGTDPNIVIEVTDGTETTSLPPFTIRVYAPGEVDFGAPTSTNAPPEIYGHPPTSTLAGSAYEFSAAATDPDGDSLTFSIANRPPWATFDNTGRLAGTPSAADVGTYSSVLVSVSDGVNVAALRPFDIVVGAAGTNVPPFIFGQPPTTVSQGQWYTFTPTAGDPNGDALIFSITGSPPWASFDASTGRLSGSPSGAGVYPNIRISVSDGQQIAALPAFSVAVTSAPPNQPPTISGTPATQALVGAQYSFTPNAYDAEGSTLTFTISNRPGWATFNASTGGLSGTPTPADVGGYGNIVIRVSDGQATTSLAAFSLSVTTPSNQAPWISGTAPTQVLAGSHFSFAPAAGDADGDALTFTILNRPGWATFHPSTGRLSGLPTTADVGTHGNIVIRVSDGQATTALPTLAITVLAVAIGSATLSWTPPTLNTDGTALTNLTGYRIYWGTSRGSYPHSVTVHNAGLTSYVVEQLTSGTWYFVVTAINSRGAESSFSNEGSKTIH